MAALNEWSARRTHRLPTQHQTNAREECMPSAGFEPAIPVVERPQTYALESTARGISHLIILMTIVIIIIIIMLGRAISQATNRWRLISDAQIWPQKNLCGIGRWYIDSGADVFIILAFPYLLSFQQYSICKIIHPPSIMYWPPR